MIRELLVFNFSTAQSSIEFSVIKYGHSQYFFINSKRVLYLFDTPNMIFAESKEMISEDKSFFRATIMYLLPQR